MAIAIYQSASPTIGATEYSFAAASTSLPTDTTDGVFALVFDANAVIDGDFFLVQLYESGVAGGTKRLVDSWPIEGPPGKPMQYVPSTGAFILGVGWDLTIKKVSGTDRAMPFTLWKIS